MTPPPEVSVLVPLHDARGDSVEHGRALTHKRMHPSDEAGRGA